MNKHYSDSLIYSEKYIEKFKNTTDRNRLTEEIDSAYARANSIEMNCDMNNKNNLTRKRMWIKIATELRKIRDNI